jgi:hypothetical protein
MNFGCSNESEGTEFFSGFAHLINAMRSCSISLLWVVFTEKAVGGGVIRLPACITAITKHLQNLLTLGLTCRATDLKSPL